MRIEVSCFHCGLQRNDNDVPFVFELTDENLILPIECPKGHKNVIVLTHQKFELLFEMGLYALNDSYSREAASNFAAALERFHEFSISVMAKELESRDADTRFDSSEFDTDYHDTWKEMSRQSERQYGAYMMLYLITFKRKVKLINNNHVAFRNEVIHKGIFPKEADVVKYGTDIFDYIREKLMELRREFPESVDYVYHKELNKVKEEQYNGGILVQMNQTTSFYIEEETGECFHKSFDEARQTASEFRFFKSETADTNEE